MYVQFSGPDQAVIVSYFGALQNPSEFPNQGDVAATDPRWAAFYASIPATERSGLPAPA